MKMAPWKSNICLKKKIVEQCSGGAILPQAFAAHLTIVFGISYTEKQIVNHHFELTRIHKAFGYNWQDALQSSLFSIAAYEAGLVAVLKAIGKAMEYEASRGVKPKMFINWLYVQGFLWHVIRPPERSRPLMKLMETVLELMRKIANDFPDDESPMATTI